MKNIITITTAAIAASSMLLLLLRHLVYQFAEHTAWRNTFCAIELVSLIGFALCYTGSIMWKVIAGVLLTFQLAVLWVGAHTEVETQYLDGHETAFITFVSYVFFIGLVVL